MNLIKKFSIKISLNLNKLLYLIIFKLMIYLLFI